MEAYGITWLVLLVITFAMKFYAMATVDYPVTAVHTMRDSVIEMVVMGGLIGWGLTIFL